METKVQKGLYKNDSQPIKHRCLSSQEIRAFLKQPISYVIKKACSKEHLSFLLILERLMLLFLFGISMVLRVSLYNFKNADYTGLFQPWYDFIQTHGGFAAFKYDFSIFNVPILYLWTLATYTPISSIVAIKTISVLFDIGLALFTYLIVRLKYRHSSAPIIGAVVVLFTPTFFLNSAAWGESDAIYTACCLASLYCLLSKHPAWACLCFGLAISFKLQSIEFLPLLIVLFLKGKLPVKSLILIPVIYLALLVPALLAGRDAWSLLTIYVNQAKDSSQALTWHAPNFYYWIQATDIQDWIRIGLLLAAMIVALISYLTLKSREPITPDITLKLTLVFTLALPFFLPEMHERYFYLADIVSIIYAFYFPRSWYVAVIEQLCSLMSYAIALFNNEVVNLAYVAFAVLFLTVITLADLVKTLYPNIYRPATMLVASSNDTPSEASDIVVSPKVPRIQQGE